MISSDIKASRKQPAVLEPSISVRTARLHPRDKNTFYSDFISSKFVFWTLRLRKLRPDMKISSSSSCPPPTHTHTPLLLPLPPGRSHDGGTLDPRTRWIRRPSSCWILIVNIFMNCGSFAPSSSPRHDPLGPHQKGEVWSG